MFRKKEIKKNTSNFLFGYMCVGVALFSYSVCVTFLITKGDGNALFIKTSVVSLLVFMLSVWGIIRSLKFVIHIESRSDSIKYIALLEAKKNSDNAPWTDELQKQLQEYKDSLEVRYYSRIPAFLL